MPSVLRSAAVFALVFAVTALSMPGCSQQGEGERCDSAKNGNDDCDSGLTCVAYRDLLDKATDRCCPAPGIQADKRCQRDNGSTGSGGTDAAGGAGAGGEGGGGGPGVTPGAGAPGEATGGAPLGSGGTGPDSAGMSSSPAGGVPAAAAGAPTTDTAGAGAGGAG